MAPTTTATTIMAQVLHITWWRNRTQNFCSLKVGQTPNQKKPSIPSSTPLLHLRPSHQGPLEGVPHAPAIPSLMPHATTPRRRRRARQRHRRGRAPGVRRLLRTRVSLYTPFIFCLGMYIVYWNSYPVAKRISSLSQKAQVPPQGYQLPTPLPPLPPLPTLP